MDRWSSPKLYSTDRWIDGQVLNYTVQIDVWVDGQVLNYTVKIDG